MPTPPTDLSAIGDLERNPERSLQFEFVRATENAALACLPWLGRNAKETADDAASRAILGVLEYVDICGECVIGEGIKDNAPGIFIGDKLGTWAPGSWHVDIAVDPIDGTTNLSKGMP
ncbi:MAG: fructose-bisphosphatase class II, partial [Opitutaceae bacterium]